ncbi:DUF362 domain-containing protein [Candidatus Chlorohelix sp.]|uniref:DUF362 domain-containing protein n=1 Tax=Candidatus Chlorohelix sp. TaxID=3139201 RepID=UPI00301FF891
MTINPNRPRRRVLSRRQFTRLMLTGAIGGSVVLAEFVSRPLGIIKWISLNFRRLGKGFGEKSQVAIVNATYEGDILTPLRTAWEAVDTPSATGKRVVLKPNIIYNFPGSAINTHPAVLEAAIRLFREQGAKEVIVAEGSAYQRDITDLLYQSGIQKVLDSLNVPFVDLNHDDLVKVNTKGGYNSLEFMWLPKTIAQAELLVSMPKMKTHHWAGVTLSMKNLYGIVPGIKYGWPKNILHVTGIEQNIVELYETMPPQATIVDGIMAMEGDGPLFGTPKPAQVLVIGRDLVAVDATCARIMGFEPTKDFLKHIWYADWLGQGVMSKDRIIQKALPVESVKQSFVAAPKPEDVARY